MITVTHNATSVSPELVLGYSWQRTANNIAHEIIGSSTPSFTLRPASGRAGTLTYLCLTEEAAIELSNLHSDTGLFMLSDSDVPAAAMTYVPMGDIRVELDPATRIRWTVAVGFREVV